MPPQYQRIQDDDDDDNEGCLERQLQDLLRAGIHEAKARLKTIQGCWIACKKVLHAMIGKISESRLLIQPEDRMENHGGGTPYILRLPSEILSEIFTIYLASSQRGSTTRRRELFILGQISPTWRAILWSRTQLWNDINVVLTPRRFETQIMLIREWLVRAGDLPLSLRIGGEFGVWNQRSPVDFVTTISQFSRQWRDVDLLLPLAGFQWLDAIQVHLPLLRFLMVRLANYRDAPDPIRAFRIAPQLYQVHMYQPLSPLQFLLPWHQLTTFYGQKLYADEWFEILRNSPNLIHCSFDEGLVLRGDDSLPVSTTPLLLPRLLSISAVYPSAPMERSIFDYIVVPTAREISFEGGRGSFPIYWVESLLSRSLCALYRLSLTEMHVGVEQVRRCLHLTPTLVELELDIIEYEWDTISTDMLVLPYLSSLSVVAQTSTGLTRMLDSLTIPSARAIKLCGCNEHFNHFPFLALLGRSSCSLQRLTLDSFLVAIASLSEIFTLVPSLTALELTALDVTTPHPMVRDAVVNILCLKNSSYLLPNLQTFEYLGAPPFRAEDLEKMLSTRCRQDDLLGDIGNFNANSRNKTVRLHTVRITTSSMIPSKKASRKMDVLRAAGLNLTIQITEGT